MNVNGVEILNETQVVAESAFGWTVFWIAGSVFFDLCILGGIILSITEGPELMGWIVVICAGIILGLLFGFVGGTWFATPTKYETHYQVIIDDSVSMNDFLDKYEIIDTEGKILTIRERDN